MRPDLPEGCPEQFDRKLMQEAWRYDTERAPGIEAERVHYGANVPGRAFENRSGDREILAFGLCPDSRETRTVAMTHHGSTRDGIQQVAESGLSIFHLEAADLYRHVGR